MPRPFGRSLISLDGLSVGDAFGQRFFGNPGVMWARISQREVPHKPWIWTDDTAMARVIVACLRDEGELEPDTLSHLGRSHPFASRGDSRSGGCCSCRSLGGAGRRGLVGHGSCLPR